MNIKVKSILYLTYLKSTLLISIACAIPISFMGISRGNSEVFESYPFLQIVSNFLRVCCFAGLPISILYKEFTKKNEYYFYYNMGISKINLIVATATLYILFSIIIYIICLIIWNII